MPPAMAERPAPPPRILVGIPAYNAEVRVEETIRKTRREGVSGILVVDDGSTDRTPQILDRLAAEDPSVTVIHQRKRGYGGAHKTILAAFERSDADLLVVLHGDGQHAPEEMGTLIAAVRGGADVVLGSRALGNMLAGGMPLYKYRGIACSRSWRTRSSEPASAPSTAATRPATARRHARYRTTE